jgi:hypothetical protein
LQHNLKKYLELLSGFNSDKLNSEIVWAERELSSLIRMEETNMIKVSVSGTPPKRKKREEFILCADLGEN